MTPIAWKNMRAEKARFGFSVAGVAVSALLLAFMLALYQGWNQQIASYIEDVPADIWVAQKGNESFFTASLIPMATLEDLRETEGVADVGSLLGRTIKLDHDGDTLDSYVLGVDDSGLGGPLHIKKGTGDLKIGEIVIDDVLARTAGVHVGDTVTAGGSALKVVGISSGGNIVLNQLSFVSMEQARSLVGLDGFANFGLVRVAPGADEADVTARINQQQDGVTAFEKERYASESRKVLRKSILPILAVLLVLGFIVGGVVVALTIYTATVEKEREYGVMKALGARNRSLTATVVQQSLTCGVLGFAIGYVAVVAASRFAERLVPQFVTLLRWQDAAIVFGAVAVMCIAASYLPLQRVLRVDPLRVFKA